jgi:hypothetical protein
MSAKFVFWTSGPYVVELMLMQVIIYVPKSPNLLKYDANIHFPIILYIIYYYYAQRPVVA